MQTVAIAAKCHKFINENLHTTIRGLFYQLKYSLGDDVDENIFNEQAESNPLIEDLEAALSLKREDLNLNANRKGVLAGNLKIMDTFGGEQEEIDASKMGRSGWAIPSDVDNEIEFVDVKAKSVLVVEKDALWQRLNEDGLWKKENMILISPQGQAARGTRRLIRKLADEGPSCLCIQRRGRLGMVHLLDHKDGQHKPRLHGQCDSHAGGQVPRGHHVGPEEVRIPQQDDAEGDRGRPQEGPGDAQLPVDKQAPRVGRGAEDGAQVKVKLEQDTLQGPRLTFVGDYIKDKIKNKDWLP